MFELIQAILTREYQRQLFFLKQFDASRHLKPTMSQCSLSPGRILSGHNFQSSTFEAPKFSQSFLPLPFRWVLPAGLGLGPQLPRPNTTDSGSCEIRQRLGRSAASRGQGSSECG